MLNTRRKTKNKKIFILILFLILGFLFITNLNQSRLKAGNQLRPTNQSSTPTNPTPIKSGQVSHSLFIPYWSLSENLSLPAGGQPDSLIYFGIAPDLSGINKSDPGYTNLSNFMAVTKESKTFLTLRMTNTDTNLKILENIPLQQKIRDETIQVAKENGFDGIVLDLEVAALPTEDLKNSLSMFITDFLRAVKSENMQFMMTVYGDNFYRGRPYDLANLTTYTDQFLIMMYDLHKAAGEPGPNFPLSKGAEFDYDLIAATDSFLKVLPPEKITVVFGLYGYDWALGPQGKPLKPATALSLAKIRKEFLENCQYKNCKVKRDKFSEETQVTYIDDSGYNHEVWFEDEKSIEEKINYLKTKGISNFSFWARGYF